MLGTTTRHALRTLTLLASLPNGSSLLTRELAEATLTPSNYLAKIMVQLAHACLVEGKRGAGGGYRLARPASQIPILEVVEALEGKSHFPTCLLAGFRQCTDDNGCPAHARFKKVRDAWEEFLASTTLADIAFGFSPNLEEARLLWKGENAHGER